MQHLIFSVLLVAGTFFGSPAAADGAGTYSAQCAQCHGADGGADTPVGKAMKATDLRGKTWSQEELTAAIRENSRHNAVSSKISDEDLSALAEFLPTLAGE